MNLAISSCDEPRRSSTACQPRLISALGARVSPAFTGRLAGLDFQRSDDRREQPRKAPLDFGAARRVLHFDTDPLRADQPGIA